MKEVIAQSNQPTAVERPLEPGQQSNVSNLDGLSIPTSFEPEVRTLELRQADQRQEQQLYGLLDSQAIAIVIMEITRDPSDEAQRRRLEAVQAEMLLNEQEREKRKRGRSSFFGEVTFRNLAAVLGADAAESISQKLEKLSQSGGGGLQSNPNAVAQIAKEIATSLEGHDTLLRLGVSPTQVEHAITQALLSRVNHVAAEQPAIGAISAGEIRREPFPLAETKVAAVPAVLDHPIHAIRQSLIQMSEPTTGGIASPITLPEMEQLSRHLLATAQQHGFNGDRGQLAQTLYLVAHQLESARVQDSAVARDIATTMFVQQYGAAKSELVDVALDLVTRVQHAKAMSTGHPPPEGLAASLDSGPGMERDREQPRIAHLNLEHQVELKISPEVAPRFVLASPEALSHQLNRLGILAAQAAMRGEPEIAASIRQEAHDTIHDNRHIVDAMSPSDRQELFKRLVDAEVAETGRIKAARTNFEEKLIAETEKLALASAEALAAGTLTEDQIFGEFRDAASSLLASTETYLVGNERDAVLQRLEAQLKDQILEKRDAVLEKDRDVLAQLGTDVEAEVKKAPEIALSHALSENRPTSAVFDSLVEKARNDLQAKLQDPQFELLARRNPQAREQLERRFEAAVEQARRTIANLDLTQLRQLIADPVGASKRDPRLMSLLLGTPEGLQALRSKLESLATYAERVALLKELQNSLGINSFAAIMDRYDRSYGRPLGFDLMSMGDHTSAAYRQLVEDCFGSSATLFTAEQRERFLTFARQDAAMTLAVTTRERRLLRDAISSAERARTDLQLKMAPELAKLGITGLADVSAAEMQRRVLEELTKMYPGLQGKTWDEVVVSLEQLGGVKDAHEFKQKLVETKKIDGRTAAFMQFEEVLRQQKLLSEVLPVLTGQMRAFGEFETQLSRLRTQEAHGVQDEPRLLEERYKEIYGTTFETFSDASFQHLHDDALLYLDGLHRRIENASEGERSALCAERDSIEWRSVASRIDLHLGSQQPQVNRSLQLLAEFEVAHGTGPTQRSKAFRDLAHTLREAITHVENFAAQQERLSSVALERTRGELPRLDLGLQSKEEEVQAAKEHRESFWFDTADFRKAVSVLSNRRRELRDLQTERDRTQTRLNALEGLPETVGVETRRALLGQLLRERPGTESGGYLTPDAFRARLTSHGTAGLTPEAFEPLAKVFEQVRSSHSAMRASLANPATGPVLTSFAASVQSPMQERELVTNVEEALRHDEGTAPSEESLRALQQQVDSSSPLGRHIQVVFAATTDSRQRMDQLYARLSAGDVARVRTFLVTHDRPQLLTASLPAVQSQDAKGVWSALAALPEEQAIPLLGKLTVERQLQEVQRILQDIPEDRRSAVMTDYERVTGRSLGASILDLRPRGNQGIDFVLQAARSLLVTERDLRPYFPDGKVPESLEQRRAELLELFQRDSGRALFDEQAVQDLAQEEAGERAALQVALSMAIQQGRTQDAEAIRSNLDQLDENFSCRSEELLSRVSPDYAARADLRDVVAGIRSFHTQSKVMEIAGPYGPIARTARDLVSLLEHRPPKFDEVVLKLREANYSGAEMHLLRAYYTHHAVAPRVSDGSIALSGDLRLDLEALKTDQERLEPDPKRPRLSSIYDDKLTGLLLVGGVDALTQHDLEMLSKGIRDHKPQFATRAMVTLSAARGTEEAAETLNAFLGSSDITKSWSQIKDNPAFAGASAYSQALVDNNTVQMAAVELHDISKSVTPEDIALAAAVIKYRNNPKVRDLALITAAYESIYGHSPLVDLKEAVPGLGHAWEQVLSSDPAQRIAASAAFVKVAVQEKASDAVRGVIDLDLVNRSLSLVATKEEREQVLKDLNEWAKGLPRSAVLADGEAGYFIEYVRSRSPEFAEADAAILGAMFRAPDQLENTPPLRPEQLTHYLSERDTLMYQMREIDAFHAHRSQVHEQAANFHITICNTHSRAVKDYDNRTVTAELARTKVIADNFMRQNQAGLIGSQLHGLQDIRCMRETMRLRGVALLQDIATGIDRGLSAELNNRTFSDLKERDKKIEWILARSDAMKIWHREAKAAQAELAKWDRRIEIANTVAKVVVVAGLSFVPFVGPGGAFLVATAWNAADKGFRMVYNGLSPREALRQFAIELVFDAACAGMGAFKAVRVVTQPGVAAAKEGVKEQAKTVFLRSLFNTPAKFEGQSVRHLIVGRLDVFRGAEGKLTKAAFEGAERLFQNPKVLGNMVVAEIKGSWWNATRLLAYTPLPFLINRPLMPQPQVLPTPVQPPVDGGPGAAGVPVKPVTTPPNQPIQVVTPVPVDKDRQEVVALVQNLKASLENLVPSIRDSVSEGLKTVERMLEDKGVTLEEIKSALESLQQQAATTPPPPASEPPAKKTDLERWLASGNLYEGVFDFLNSYNPWADLLAGLGRAQAAVAPYFPPPYIPPPVKPPESPSPNRPSRGDSPDNGASYGPRLAVDNGDGNSYTRYRPAQQENVARMFKHDPLAAMQGVPNQAALMAAEALDARAKTQLILAAEAAKLALQQTQQLAQASAAGGLQISQGQQQVQAQKQAESQQHTVALEQAQKALERLAHTESSTLTAIHQAPRLIEVSTTSESVSVAAASSTPQADTTDSSRPAHGSEARESTTITALQSGEVHAQLHRPAMRTKTGELAQPSKIGNSQANSAPVQSNDEQTSPALLALTSVSEAPRLKSSKEHSPLTERPVTASERPFSDLAQVAPQAGAPRASQERTQIHVDGTVHGSLLSDALSLQARPTPSYWNTPSAAAAVEELNEDGERSNGGSQAKAAAKARKDKLRRDAQLRQGIIQQLLTQVFEASKREKLLAVLIKLGISEKEYRELVVRVGEYEAQQMAQSSEQEQLFRDADKIALTTSGEMVAASEMATHTTTSEAVEQKPAQAQPKPTTRSRADLYRSLQRGKTTDEVL